VNSILAASDNYSSSG